MCEIPSWFEKGKTVLFVTDKDAKQHGIELRNATGHSAVQKVFGGGNGNLNHTFRQGEGFHKNTPKVILKAIEAGKMNAILSAGEVQIHEGKFKIPAPIFGTLLIRKGAKVNAPNLREVVGNIVMEEGSELIAPKLKKFDIFDGFEPFKLKSPIKIPA